MGQTPSKDEHGNSGFVVKNLAHTSGCPHYEKIHQASDACQLRCPNINCPNKDNGKPTGCATNACHLIFGNTNDQNAKRMLVDMCGSCNKIYKETLHLSESVRDAGQMKADPNPNRGGYWVLPDNCACGHWSKEGENGNCAAGQALKPCHYKPIPVASERSENPTGEKSTAFPEKTILKAYLKKCTWSGCKVCS